MKINDVQMDETQASAANNCGNNIPRWSDYAMKITAIETFPVEPRWLFLKISTDEGLFGWGECLGDKAYVIAEAVRSYEGSLIGEDPLRITHIWQSLYRQAFWRGGPTLNAAISGIEIALWDIKGKSLGVPVYSLLGGPTRDKIRVYPHLKGDTPTELAANAKEIAWAGYTGMKFCPFKQVKGLDSYGVVLDAVARVAVVREVIGPGVDLMLDFHGRVSPAMAIQMEQALREFHPFFIEEPVLPDNVDAMAKVAAKFQTPIATGERLFTKWGYQEILEKRCVAVLQPDPCICGGILEAVHISAMAEAQFVSIAPHNPYGPINLAAALQVDAAIPNFVIQEFVHLGEGYLKQPFVVEDGFIRLPTGPGLGIEVDEDFVRSKPLGRLPDVGRWFHEEDGSVADW
ncbi:MAG: galactonate dehydratase [Chthonomonadales bacterium]